MATKPTKAVACAATAEAKLGALGGLGGAPRAALWWSLCLTDAFPEVRHWFGAPDQMKLSATETVMSPETASLARLYEAFNARDIDAALSVMHPDVKWPNGWEGGYVFGRQAVRDYWTRQWAEIDSAATPTAFETLPDGQVRVLVKLRAVDRNGALLWENVGSHTYAFDAGKIRSMEIGNSE